MMIHVRLSVIMLGLLMLSTQSVAFSGTHKSWNTNSFTQEMFSVLPSLHDLDQDLIGLAQDLTYGKTPAQVVLAILYFYGDVEVPLMVATQDLIRQKDYVGAAIDVAQAMLNVIPSNTSRAGEIQQWIVDLNTLLTCIEYVLEIIKDNPQLVAMILKK